MSDDDAQIELYHPDLLRYAKAHPLMRERQDADHVVKAYNPYCGDKFEVHFNVNNKIIADVSFFGYGCVVSKASTGLLAETLEGKSLDEAKSLISEFLENLEPDSSSESQAPNVRMLMVARKYPGRVQCAGLAWEAAMGHPLFATNP